MIRRFPFALYDVMEATSIDIYAILDCRRDPIWIRRQSSSSSSRRGSATLAFGQVPPSLNSSPPIRLSWPSP
ncbi:hypothetical protein CyaNS01_01457 [Cyanobium sp. NS01]|nr:hypothetical protein CyaNS01_01457 [Cyanobium sp. NS01]